MEGVSVVIIFVVVTLVTMLLFGVWLFVTIVRLTFRAIGAIGSSLKPPPRLMSMGGRHANDCDAINPPDAAFCRRCGRRIRADRQMVARRVAMW